MSVVSLNNTINSKLYESGVFDIDTSNINDATSEGSTASAKLATMAADVKTCKPNLRLQMCLG